MRRTWVRVERRVPGAQGNWRRRRGAPTRTRWAVRWTTDQQVSSRFSSERVHASKALRKHEHSLSRCLCSSACLPPPVCACRQSTGKLLQHLGQHHPSTRRTPARPRQAGGAAGRAGEQLRRMRTSHSPYRAPRRAAWPPDRALDRPYIAWSGASFDQGWCSYHS